MTDTLSDTRRPAQDAADTVTDTFKEEMAAYRGGEDLPMESFAGLMAAYVGFVAAGAVAVRRKGLPDRLPWSDIALVGLATHRLSRLVAKAPVTSPLRAPFARYAGTTGPAELEEEVRGTGARKAVGELLTCPFCLSQWLATAFTFGVILAPRGTRLAAAALSSVSVADYLQFARSACERRA